MQSVVQHMYVHQWLDFQRGPIDQKSKCLKMAGKDRPLHHGHAPPWRKKSPRSRSFFLLSPRIFLVVLSSRSYDDVSDDVTLPLMTCHSTAVLKSCTVQLYSTMDSMGTRAHEDGGRTAADGKWTLKIVPRKSTPSCGIPELAGDFTKTPTICVLRMRSLMCTGM